MKAVRDCHDFYADLVEHQAGKMDCVEAGDGFRQSCLVVHKKSGRAEAPSAINPPQLAFPFEGRIAILTPSFRKASKGI